MNPLHTPAQGIKQRLERIESELAELVVDAQDHAEDDGVFSPGFFTGDSDDIPLCVPEDACPELDLARTLIQDLIEQMDSVAKEGCDSYWK